MAKLIMKKRGFLDGAYEDGNVIDLAEAREIFSDYTFEFCGGAPPIPALTTPGKFLTMR